MVVNDYPILIHQKKEYKIMKFRNIVTGALTVCIMMSMAVSVSATDASINEDEYTESAAAALVGSTGSTARISHEVGHGTAEWNSFFNWGRAVTEAWSWAEATYLYARATVSASGCVDVVETISSTTKQSVTTAKAYQSVTKNRNLSTYHIVKGYWNGESTLLTEYYAGNFDF